MTEPPIKVNLDRRCKRCDRRGATDGGYCLHCIAKAIEEGADHILKRKGAA